MVAGLDIFREYFKNFGDNYIIIGGTAGDLIISEADLTPRATKDIDLILIIEALSKEFVEQFWNFIEEGKYDERQKNQEERKYYRFLKPQTDGYPVQIELFSRVPDVMDIKEGSHLTPIPTDEALSSLSAILMDDDYYNFTLKNSQLTEGIHIANTAALICLKAKAWLDLAIRKEQGEEINSKEIRKHKNDIFRYAILLAVDQVIELPATIKKDLQYFLERIKDEIPGKAIFKEMGLSGIDTGKLIDQLKSTFEI